MSSSLPTDADIVAQATQYVDWEPNEGYKAQINTLLSSNNVTELRSLFYPRISFGTAGLRARMAPGYKNINELVIIQTTQGLLQYIKKQHTPDNIVVGYDGRYNSRRYAEIVASIFMNAGVKVHMFQPMVGTPLVPFAVLHYKSSAGIMVTASHNPKDDNGYKVYWNNGAQIIPPHDSGIAACIMENLKPWGPVTFDANHPLLHNPFQEITDLYFSKASELYCRHREANKSSSIKVVYTAMHGVGAPFTARALQSFDLPPYIPTKEQVEADPEFPTVKFPNPEEGKGALQLAMNEADRSGATLILANDPDADRLAIAERQANGEWKILNGNEIAALLADWEFQNYKKQNPNADLSKAVMISSTVSSKFIKSMAKKEGFLFLGTLTGFKWMGNVADEFVKKGYHFLFAYEVEIGFLVGNLSYDKDGIRTAAVFNEMVNQLHLQGKTCASHLEELYQRYGYFNMNTHYFFCDRPVEQMAVIFKRLRSYENGTYPTKCGPYEIDSVRDATIGFDTSKPGNKAVLPPVPDQQMLTFRFKNGSLCTLRGSGTEPKLKYYVESSASTPEEAARITADLLKYVIDEFIQPVQNGLVAPKPA